MKDTVKWPTFPYDEYRARIGRAQECLDQHGLDAMLLFAPVNWHYYGGFHDPAQLHSDVWRTALLVCRDRDPVAVAHIGLYPSIATQSWVDDVRLWADADNPLLQGLPRAFDRLLLDTLADLHLDDKRLGVETGTELDTYLGIDEYHALCAALPRAQIVSADPAIWAQRMIKTPWEHSVIREGARRACECVRAAFEAIHPGANERDVHRAYWRRAADLDMIEAPYWGTWTCFTTNAREPLGFNRWIVGPVDRIIEVGDQGSSDGGPAYKGYQFDFQRTFCVGKPPEKLLKYHGIATAAHLETISHVRPGTRICDVYQAAFRALQRRGYEWPPVISFIGHQEGLNHHEPPWIVAEETTVLQPGMVLAIEIGAFDPDGDVFGAMPEDVILVTDSDPEILTAHLSHELWIA